MLLQVLILAFVAWCQVIVALNNCKCTPVDACWPSNSDWNALNSTISGQLIKNQPAAIVCYPGSLENLNTCASVLAGLTNSTFIAQDPIALDFPIVEACPAVNYAAGASPGNCSLGGSPVYTVNATTVEDVVAGVNFAREKNLRLVVRNTGHDGLGKTTGYGSLEVWIHYLRHGITFQDTYIASGGCSKSGWKGGVMKIGGGYVWSEAYAEANARNVVVVGGGDPSVGCIGGWAQGGGHSPASHNYGLGADQILEAEVVTASGQILTVNACQNSDLYTALRGGGGGTYAVVVSTTIKTHPSTPVVAQVLAMAPLTDAYITEFMEALAILYSSFPALNEGGYSGYGSWDYANYQPVFGNFTTGYQHTFAVFNQSLGAAQTLFAPVAIQLAPYTNESLFISISYIPFPSYQAYYTTLSGHSSAVGANAAVTSRFLDKQALTSSRSALKKMLNVTAGNPGQFTATNLCVVAGGQVAVDAADTYSGVNPAWRTAVVHNIVAEGWAPGSSQEIIDATHRDITYVKTGAMRKIAPRTGSYLNEADWADPWYKEDFYGEALGKLEVVKRRWDCEGVFYCPTCVGSWEWKEDEVGRLCRA